jgi:hypothetical protein
MQKSPFLSNKPEISLYLSIYLSIYLSRFNQRDCLLCIFSDCHKRHLLIEKETIFENETFKIFEKAIVIFTVPLNIALSTQTLSLSHTHTHALSLSQFLLSFFSTILPNTTQAPSENIFLNLRNVFWCCSLLELKNVLFLHLIRVSKIGLG